MLPWVVGGLGMGVVGSLLAVPVTKAHMEELSKPNLFCWHVVGWYGMHEDMHLLMVVSDVVVLWGMCVGGG